MKKINYFTAFFLGILFLFAATINTYAQIAKPSQITKGVYKGRIDAKDFKPIKNMKDFEEQRAIAKSKLKELEKERNPQMKIKLYPPGHNDLPQAPDPLLQGVKGIKVAPVIVEDFFPFQVL